jgi:hypothetical protein
MVGTLKKLKKLKGRSLEELRVRGAQALAATSERRGWSAQSRVPTDEAFIKLIDAAQINGSQVSAESLLEHFRLRTKPHFFASFDEREATLAQLRHRWPEAERSVIERAEKNREGRFDLLGLSDLDFGNPVDWHLEPVSGKRAPRDHWSKIDYLDAEIAGDKKIVWELNRHQHFTTLGRAYWYTRDERFSAAFITHLTLWMDENPPKIGINWASSLEVSLRAINWLWALCFFKDSTYLTPAVFLRVLKFLHLHARHLETYLSTYFSPNTHLTGEALGLFYLGTLLPEFKSAARWRETGRRILLAELDRHVRADGVYFEQSSYYHRYTTDFYTHFLLLSRRSAAPVEPQLESKLMALLDHLMYITRPDGTSPLYGDDDGGQLLMLDECASNDFRATLSTGAALFKRADYKFVAASAAQSTLWLTGTRGLEAFDRMVAEPPALLSKAFPDGGYFVMRDDWTPKANYLFVDCGPHGALRFGHAHADALSFELAAHGRTLLVDPGTFTYTGSVERRDYFRSSQAHNTLTIDGESSSVPEGTFAWSHVARARMRNWIGRERFDFFVGEHDGYTRLSAPALHTRCILFLKHDYWIIRDRIKTSGEHRYELRFHYAGAASPVLEAGAGAHVVRERTVDEAGLEIYAFGDTGTWKREDGSVSECYGAAASAPVYVFSAEGLDAQEFDTFLLPRAATATLGASVKRIEAAGGRGFEVLDEDTRDVLLLNDGHIVEGERFVTDFEWAWARFSRSDERLLELVLIQGRQLSLDGQEILNLTEPVNYAFARPVEGRLLVETENEIYELDLPVVEFKFETSDT